MKDYLDGRITYKEVLKAATNIKKKQTQSVTSKQVGDFNQVISGVGSKFIVATHSDSAGAFEAQDAQPPILRLDIETKYKVLHTEEGNHSPLGYNTFLALSDRMFREYYEFFLQPHTTRIIWSMHKIIYVFTHISNNLTLYYDMDLVKMLDNRATGGRIIKTATIVTKGRIFIPVIPEMDDYFSIKEGQLNFSVRFDSVP